MKIYDCDRFEFCSAPICPIWKPIIKQRIIKGEELCLYLLEYQKEKVRPEIFKDAYLGEIAKVMAKATEEIFTLPGIPAHLVSALIRATTTGSRILAGRKLNG
ncbi:hypothetical protein [Polynucleobacter sp. AP-Reno-20A-A9]|uniref:hypothetical protein n=1 Tax=Polynucleobacter sp. AP-Reno-20A-A9 TaxID=2576925 RepID=UPI001C0D5589|nr:hypothetical protein [Polynucleobacter sp. AP-Reno-20A-A9]MBU3628525.1 hypothetical protein [Polynucleobacter sp. AP-Reno-20A-A9]